MCQLSLFISYKVIYAVLTVCVTRWWMGPDYAALLEPTSSHENCLPAPCPGCSVSGMLQAQVKIRRVPALRWTLCWAAYELTTLPKNIHSLVAAAAHQGLPSLAIPFHSLG